MRVVPVFEFLGYLTFIEFRPNKPRVYNMMFCISIQSILLICCSSLYGSLFLLTIASFDLRIFQNHLYHRMHYHAKNVEPAKKGEKKKSWRILVLLSLQIVFFMFNAMIASIYLGKHHDDMTFQSSNVVFQSRKPSRRSGRFPIFGTKEFEKECKWAVPPPNSSEPTCLIFFSQGRHNEGLAYWVAGMAQVFQFSRYKGCKMLFNYWKDVDVGAVVVPPNNKNVLNWTVSDEFSCSPFSKCRTLKEYRNEGHIYGPLFLRFAYNFYKQPMSRNSFKEIQAGLEGYRPESSMACSLGALLHLSPTANQFESDLFTKILPALQDEETLVLALYMRTGRTDAVVRSEQEPDKYPLINETNGHQKFISDFEACAFGLEEKYLSGKIEPDAKMFSRVIWMVVTDSPFLKEYMPATYSGQDTNSKVEKSKQKWKSKVIPREVLTTKSRGKHTKTNHKVDTSAFAEAFIDWYLIGESDAVLVDRSSTFGPMGAMRTSRPVYRTNVPPKFAGPAPICSKPSHWIREDNTSSAT